MTVLATGSDGWEGMRAHLDDTKALYGGFQAKITGLPILFQFFFQGESLPPIKRGKTRIVKLGVFAALDGTLGEVVLEGMSEATKDNIIAMIDESAGGVGPSEITF